MWQALQSIWRVVRQVLQFVWGVVWWFLTICIPLWLILLLVVVLCVGLLIWFRGLASDGEETKPEVDKPLEDVVKFDKKMDIFRAKWDIYGRFEAWPALLPLAEMSNVAYSSEEEAKSFAQRLGFDSIVPIESPFHSHCAYIAHGKDVMVIAFRGTNDKEDWFSNANIFHHQMTEGILHSGFGSAYGTLQSRIWQEIKKEDPKHIWITGHSLGGAMALVCAYDLEIYRNRNIDGVITFGQPRLGNQELMDVLQKKLSDRYVRFRNESDIVPQLPRSFSHCGLFLRFVDGRVEKSADYFLKAAMSVPKDNQPRDYEYVPVDKEPEISQKEFDEFMQMYEQQQEETLKGFSTGPYKAHAMLPRWFQDHSMDLYVEKIRNAIKKATNR